MIPRHFTTAPLDGCGQWVRRYILTATEAIVKALSGGIKTFDDSNQHQDLCSLKFGGGMRFEAQQDIDWGNDGVGIKTGDGVSVATAREMRTGMEGFNSSWLKVSRRCADLDAGRALRRRIEDEGEGKVKMDEQQQKQLAKYDRGTAGESGEEERRGSGRGSW